MRRIANAESRTTARYRASSAMSRGFFCALAGVALTLFAWYGPWAWPAWPAFAVIDAIWGTNQSFADLPYTVRSLAVAMLIVVNVGVWGLLLRVVVWMGERMQERLRPRTFR